MKNIFLLLMTLFLSFSLKAQNQDTITLHHSGYSTLWSKSLNYPLLVRWWNTKERCGCKPIQRKDRFAPDPLLISETNIQSDYDLANKTKREKQQKGFDRGHMSPAADNQCPYTSENGLVSAEKMMTESFYFSNMTPQYHSLNAGDWKKLEVRTRNLALEHDSVYVWCGSFGVIEKIGNLSIPQKCWKIIYIKKINTYEAYLFENSTDKPKGLELCKSTVGEIEKLTGFKFSIN